VLREFLMSRYLIGIDLGTTNSALAYIDARSKGQPRIHSFAVPQLVAPGELAERPLLPSFLYLPGPHDLPPKACALPWDPERAYAVGEFARNHGAHVPGRLVTSAKSWLAHAGVDRTAALLPWSAPPEVSRISPVEASARYLRHLADAWNYRIAKDRPEDQLEKQQVVLTVPASFDDVARNLTVEAARKAGIQNLTLLEEPQAAFYSWLAHRRTDERDKREHSVLSTQYSVLLKPGMVCLVVDVGGGTSDFSLIQAVEQQGELGFVRQAVGDHQLLGGDNMDLALAKYVEGKLPHPARLDAASFGMLTQACRLAKETLLAPSPPAEHTVTVMGRGRLVVGGAQHTPVTPAEVKKIIFDGFFPVTSPDAEPARGARVGLHEMGLPYVSDPAVTRHLAAFLQHHHRDQGRPPDAILFNGGVFQPLSLRERLLEVLHHWYDQPGRPWQPLVLASASLDLAVAWGAAYYGWLRHTGGRRITGGLARSYYVAVETDGAPREASAQPSALDVLCVVPQHLEEGGEIKLDQPELELALGQPVTFPLYTSTVRGDDQPGQLLQVQPQQLLRLPPLHTILRGGKRSGTKRVPVTLAARLTEIGTLELWCVARQSDNRWRLEFNTRDIVPAEEVEAATKSSEGPQAAAITDVWPEEKVQVAAQLVRSVYADKAEQPARDLTKALEAGLEASRHEWPTGLCRRLWDFLAEVADNRRLSPAHLSRWYHLVGYCLRPGFGDPLDKFRVEQLWKMLHAPVRADGPRGVPPVMEGGADYWIMWRRVAGGLNPSLQQALLDRVRPVLLPSKRGKGAAYKPGANELAEMWRATASLERLDAKVKEQLGQTLLKPLRRSPVPTYGYWALTRLGSRVLLYGPLNTIVHPQVVEAWLVEILPFQPGNASERQAWLFCLSQLARRTGQRALDVSEEMRQQVLATLQAAGASPHLLQMVKEGGELESSEQKQFFGESLPIGLRLLSTGE
jgi:hypothetical protein